MSTHVIPGQSVSLCMPSIGLLPQYKGRGCDPVYCMKFTNPTLTHRVLIITTVKRPYTRVKKGSFRPPFSKKLWEKDVRVCAGKVGVEYTLLHCLEEN